MQIKLFNEGEGKIQIEKKEKGLKGNILEMHVFFGWGK